MQNLEQMYMLMLQKNSSGWLPLIDWRLGNTDHLVRLSTWIPVKSTMVRVLHGWSDYAARMKWAGIRLEKNIYIYQTAAMYTNVLKRSNALLNFTRMQRIFLTISLRPMAKIERINALENMEKNHEKRAMNPVLEHPPNLFPNIWV